LIKDHPKLFMVLVLVTPRLF